MSEYIPKKGDIVKIHHWHGVVLAVYTAKSGQTVLKVQTARNVFRKLPPELIELTGSPAAVTPATVADLMAEVEQHRRVQDSAIEALLAAIPVAQPA